MGEGLSFLAEHLNAVVLSPPPHLGPPPVADYTYDLSGRTTKIVRDNFTTTDISTAIQVNLGYNGAGQLKGIGHRLTAATSYFESTAYSLNANNGRRESIPRTGGWNDTYGYDKAGQVTTSTYAATSGPATEGFA